MNEAGSDQEDAMNDEDGTVESVMNEMDHRRKDSQR